MVRRLRLAAAAVLMAGLGVVGGDRPPSRSGQSWSATAPGALGQGPEQLHWSQGQAPGGIGGGPGCGCHVADHHQNGQLRVPEFGPGTYLLSVSAPGYETLSNGSEPGVEVTINPGPPQVPPGITITQGLTGVIQLAPLSPPPVCSGPGPTQVNALTGIVDSAANARKVKHLSVSITNPATGAEISPGPIQKPGEFIQVDLDPGTWDLAVAAPDYTGFSGVQVTVNPGPPQDIGTISLGTELGILLPAVQ